MRQVLRKTLLSKFRIKHSPSEDVLGLLREERDYMPKELQNPCLQELREYTSMESPGCWTKLNIKLGK